MVEQIGRAGVPAEWMNLRRDAVVREIIAAARVSRITSHGIALCGPPASGKSFVLRQIADDHGAAHLDPASPGFASVHRYRTRKGHQSARGSGLRNFWATTTSGERLLCLDDAGATGRASSMEILRTAEEAGAAIIAAIRADDIKMMLETRHPFRHLHVMDLPPLTQVEVGTMCKIRLAADLERLAAQWITDLSGGSPSRVQEIVETNLRAGRLWSARGFVTGTELIVPASATESADLQLLSALLDRADSAYSPGRDGRVDLVTAQRELGPDALAALLRHRQVRLISSMSTPGLSVGQVVKSQRQHITVETHRTTAAPAAADKFGNATDGYTLLLPDDTSLPGGDVLPEAVIAARHGDLNELLSVAAEVHSRQAIEWADRDLILHLHAQAKASAGAVAQATRDLTGALSDAWSPGYSIALSQCYLAADQPSLATEEAQRLQAFGLCHRQPRDLAWGIYLEGAARLAGDPSTALKKLLEALVITETYLPADPLVPLCLSAAAVCAGWQGDALAVREYVSQAHYDDTASLLLVLMTELSLAEADLVVGLVDRAARKSLNIAERATEHGFHHAALRAFVIAARAHRTTGMIEIKGAAARCDYPAAGLHLQYAQALNKADGKELEAVSHAYQDMDLAMLAGEAAAWAEHYYKSHGLMSSANRAGQRATAVLRSADLARPLHWPHSEVQALTAREREIANLIAVGMTPQVVAKELRVSRRTVENHLLRCYRKLGINSHTELRELLPAVNNQHRTA